MKKNGDWLVYETEEEVVTKANSAIGIPFKEYCPLERLEGKNKGSIGQMIEENWFNIKNNSKPEPDFNIPGIELKVTGYYKLANDIIKAKERLVFNIINYNEEVNKSFIDSSFMKKNKHTELMCYEYHKDIEQYPVKDWFISHAHLLKFENLPTVDQQIIILDYMKINKKIQEGKAHEISEGDTMYLAACTKGDDSDSVTTQPYSDTLAKRRAYSFKPSYMNVILNNYIINNNQTFTNKQKDESIIQNKNEIENTTFEDIVINKIQKYIGMDRNELIKQFNLGNSKSINAELFSKMLGLKGNVNNTEEFKKANILVKTIQVDSNNKIKESMSFSAFNPLDFDYTEWEDSKFYSDLSRKFLFIIFKKLDNKKIVFEKAKFWSMPNSDLDEAKKVWNKTKEIFTSHTLIVESINGKNINNLPKISENPICHVRPKARDASDTYVTQQGTMLTKQCFWLNAKYIENAIK